MKIAAFNMRFGGGKRAAQSWKAVVDGLSPDIVLAQESFDPREHLPDGASAWNCHWVPAVDRTWGSAILCKDLELEPLTGFRFEGHVVGAKALDLFIDGASQSVTLFSIHAPSSGSYVSAVHQIMDDIARQRVQGPMIVGGDFNVTTAVRQKGEIWQTDPEELQLLERLRSEFDLVNAWQELNPDRELPQTLRWSGNKEVPYHCDGIFVSTSLLPHLVSAEVVTSGTWEALSDHNPLVISFG